MGLFSGEAEAKRKQHLRELEDKRLQFAQRLAAEGFAPDACLFAQHNGGFTAVAKTANGLFLLSGPAPGMEGDFSIIDITGQRARHEDIFIKSEGMGGLLGFGKKGGSGFKLIFQGEGGADVAIEIVAGLNSFLEITGGKNGLLNQRRRRGNANFVWDFRPVEREHVPALRKRWTKLINGISE
jgi:hypothetical protein